MDISKQFSFEDFLAYFFPGIVSALGIYVFFIHLLAENTFPEINKSILNGAVSLVFSYIIGVLQSNIIEIVLDKFKSHKGVLPFHKKFNNAIISAFNNVFPNNIIENDEWSKEHFYFCRSLIREYVKGISSVLRRQSSLRQFRVNLLPSIVMWGVIGVIWIITDFEKTDTAIRALLIASVVISCLVVLYTTFNRARSNEKREVREVLSAFLVGYETGLFDNKENKKCD